MDLSATAPPFIPATGLETTTAALDRQGNDRVATEQTSASTRDFNLDTFFNPVWTTGPHVFSFADNGTVVRPETYASEAYPGYRTPRLGLVGVLDFYRFSGTTELRNGVAGEEKEDADTEEARERARALAELAEWRRWLPYGSGAFQMPDPELVYTWPPK